ncbi:hypothetical protein [Tenacibaculum aestuarii]|uniref:hypothetical protein n=1 Tax=Tenacibaculum aestuarii TaxID=362781 RepID=UPI003894410A
MNTLVTDIISKAKINDINNLTKNDILKITELQANNQLQEKHIEALVKIYPDFVKHQVEIIKAFTNTVNNIKEEHIKAYDNIKTSINALADIIKIIAQKDNSDEVTIKLIESSEKLADKYKEILEIQERMNKSNNKIWITTLTFLGGALMLGIGALLSGGSSGGSSGKK